MTPRPYQSECVEAVLAGFAECSRQLVVLPTGAGKTCVFSWLAQRTDGRTLILAHRDELIGQAIAKLRDATGIVAEREQADHHASLEARVVVASVQTMIRRLERWPADHFALVVADEAHHALSPMWQTVLNHFGSAKVLGVTATPNRADNKNLGAYFERIPYQVGLFELVNQGYLAPIRVQALPVVIDITKVRTTAGDYNDAELGDALSPYLREIARALADHAAFRRTLAFLPLRATARAFADACRDVGLASAYVGGDSPDRDEIRERFAGGALDVVSNAMLWTEGFDDPGIDCILWLRPTKSFSLYCQGVGRGTRIAPGKRDLLLFDLLWKHPELQRLLRPAHLIASSDAVADEMTERTVAAATGGQGTLDLQGLASDTQRQREERLAAELKAKEKRKARVMDATAFALSLGQHDVVDYEPVMQWESNPMSDKQATVLKRFGIDLDTVRDAGHASKLLDMLIGRSKSGMATPKQIQMLRQFRHPYPERASYEQARAFLDQRIGKRKKAA